MRWRILSKIRSQRKTDRQKEIVKTLLRNRGLKTKKQQREFLHPPRPANLTLKQLGFSTTEMKKAVKRLGKAIRNKEEMIVYGDFDADGISGTAILWEVLTKLGAKVIPYIPERIEEGYGLNTKSIHQLKEDYPELSLIVTVDHGIVADQKVDFARKLGVEVIVTDHHQPGKTKPQATAIIHTTALSGAGVAWILARELGVKKVDSYLELAAIGTIGDLLPLVGPNRALVIEGLEKINQTKRPGLLALFEQTGVVRGTIGAYEVGFMIAPRLNAMGRLEHAMDSLRLLCTRDPERAQRLAQKLETTNRRRQKLTEASVLHAKELVISQYPEIKTSTSPKLIYIGHESYQEGVIGLVASKLVEEFYRPAIVISRRKERSKASARSIEGFNIVEAIRAASEFLVDSGGHPMAAGFTVETKYLGPVGERISQVAEKLLNKEKLTKTLKIDSELEFGDLTPEFYQKIASLAPFGIGNPQPVFATRRVKVLDARLVGTDNQHLKLRISHQPSATSHQAIGFGLGHLYSQLYPEKPIDIAYNLMINQWNGKKRLELRLKDIKIKS
jgi:single-stranded-DNA-specific exonuclease